MRVSVIEHPPRSRFVILRPHYVAMCDHGAAAMVLAALEGWTNWKLQTAEIEHVEDGIWVKLSVQQLIDDLGGAFGRTAIRTGLARLVELGYVEQQDAEGFDRAYLYRVNVDAVNEAVAHWSESHNGHRSISDNGHRPESDNHAGASGDGEKNEEVKEAPSDILIVWERYVELFDAGRQTFNPTRQRIVKNALKVRPMEMVLKALEGLRVSPHHNGQNDQNTQYLDIRYALKGNSARGESNEERIDKMAKLADDLAGTVDTVIRDLPPGVTEVKLNNRLDLCRRYIASGGTFEPRRAREAKAELEAWGFTVTKLDAAPWVNLARAQVAA